MKEIKVPMLPESVSDAVVATIHKAVGDFVNADDNLFDLETDKVMLEVPSPYSGKVQVLRVNEGDVVTGQHVLMLLDETAAASASDQPESAAVEAAATADVAMSPAVKRMMQEHSLDAAAIQGTGKDGRITKDDVQNHINKPAKAPAAATAQVSTASSIPAQSAGRTEERVPMTRLRSRIAERLKQVQNTAAMLTTFNEVDMSAAMNLRKDYKDSFEKKHGVRLGFMSFFVKAAVEALKDFPIVNAYIDGTDILYHNYCDIGVAVSSERGLVVPVVRDAENLSMAGIEKSIREYAGLARDGKLTLDDMKGGTFTITNGGVFGSMLSTPIINAPQSAILGMHNIVERAVVVNGEIVIRPMMYLALSYDHRLVDGKEAVSFLVAIKSALEDPARMILEI